MFVLAACGHAPSPPTKPAPTTTAVAALGETLTLDSKILGEQRVINVYLPPEYAKGGKFPVLHPDGASRKLPARGRRRDVSSRTA
jgi:hypothetical protein